MADCQKEQRGPELAVQNQHVRHVLFWPEQSFRKGALGICVGWTIAPLRSSEQCWPVATTIVAGILPSGSQQTLLEDLDELTRLVQRIGTCCCFCCVCSMRPEGSIATMTTATCTGCTRRQCFEKLTVVAVLSESIQDSSPNQDIPIITLASDGLPQFLSHESCDLQILLYDQSDDIATLYRHDASTQNPCTSFFSTSVLTRLTHASIVMSTLQKLLSNSQRESVLDTATCCREGSSLYVSMSSLNKTATTAPMHFESNSFVAPFTWIRENSLFVRHLLQHSRHGPGRSRGLFPVANVAHRVYAFWDKRRAADHSTNACPNCQQLLFFRQSLYEATATAIAESDEMALVLIDALLGMVIGFALFQTLYYEPNWKAMMIAIIRTHHQFLTHGLQWLERFPIGFKLNERLTENVGREIQRLWHVHEWTLRRLVTDSVLLQPVLVTTLSLTSCCLGASGLAALCVDGTRILSLHVSSIALGTQKVYQFEVFLLVTLWRLFRGKKKNILRHRTDTMQYDSMQSLLGTILFAIALFLFTTIIVYHVYFAVLHLAVGMAPFTIGIVYSLLQHFPLGGLAHRFWRPNMFTQEIVLKEQPCSGSSSGNNNKSVTRIGVRVIGFWSMVRQFRPLPL